MKENNILEVINELGAMLKKYKEDIVYKDYEIERLKNKIDSIEQYIAFYSEDTVSESSYKKEAEKLMK